MPLGDDLAAVIVGADADSYRFSGDDDGHLSAR